MSVSHPLTGRRMPARTDPAEPAVEIPQYRRPALLGIWAAAALPMAALAWLVAPFVAARLSGEANVSMAKALLTSLTAGLVWQFLLVLILVRREQGTLRWSVVREALWLRSPRSPRTGLVGGRLWLMVIPLVAGPILVGGLLIPNLAAPPADRDLGTFLASDAAATFLHGNWGWFAVIVVMLLFNTVLGEELLFRGFLLPRMHHAFGRADWVANGVLFAAYHLHVPWSIPMNLLDMFWLSYPSKRYRSAWIGIAVHSAPALISIPLLLTVVF
jgi:uncharacterized protein